MDEIVAKLHLAKQVLFIKKDGYKIPTNEDSFLIVGETEKCVVFKDKLGRLTTITLDSISEIVEVSK